MASLNSRARLLAALSLLWLAGGSLQAAQPAQPFGGAADALVVIDVQRCFLPGGALPVRDGQAVIPVINQLAPAFRHVVLTQDWHPPGHVSFASSHVGQAVYSQVSTPYGPQTLWPDHCVQGSAEAQLAPGLALPTARLILRKGLSATMDSYSALLEADGRTSTGLDGWLRSLGVRRLVLVGLATDYCVLNTALDARRLGYAVAVVEEATRGVDRDGSLEKAWSQMRQAGVQRLSLEQLALSSGSAGP